MSNEQLRTRFGDLPATELRYFLETHGTPVPDGASQQQLVDLLLDNFSANVAELGRTVSEVERQNSEQRLKATLERRIDEELRRRVEQKVAGLTLLRNVNGVLVVVVTLITGVGAVLGVSGFQGMQEKEDRAEELVNDVTNLKNDSVKIIGDHRKVASAYRRDMIRRIIEDCDEALSSFSLSLLSEELFKRVRRNVEDVKLISPASGLGDQHEEDAEILDVLRNLAEKILIFEKLAEEDSLSDRTAKLNAAAVAWRTLDLSADIGAEEHRSFIRRARAYQNNIQGVIKLIRYRDFPGNTGPLTLLDEARRLFDEATNLCPEISRSYSNLAVVASLKCERPENESIEEKRRLLREMRDSLEMALSCAARPRDKSIVLNNLAYAHLTEARLLNEAVGKKEDARRALEEARRTVEQAQFLVQPTAAVFLTAAEIACYHILMERNRWEAVGNHNAKRDKFEEIVGLLREAKKREYRGFRKWSITELLETLPVLEHLHILVPNYMEELAARLGLPH